MLPREDIAMALTVSEVARLTGISVRALHHYDEIGLVRPSRRSAAGYRLYAPADIERLQRVLFYRELELPLDEIARVLDDPQLDVRAALLEQRRMLLERATRSHALVAAIDAALTRLDRGGTMTDEAEIQGAFGDFDPAKYEDEARERWGHTEAWRESQRRMAGYGPAEIEEMKREGGQVFVRLAELLAAGVAATSTAAMDVAEDHRRHIERWFYPCSRAMHRALGEMYVQDQRFGDNLGKIREGLAAYACEAFRANAER